MKEMVVEFFKKIAVTLILRFYARAGIEMTEAKLRAMWNKWESCHG